MAGKKRIINSKMWSDPFVRSLSVDEKLAFVYFMTNSQTEICGAYEIPIEMAHFEAGVPLEAVYSLIEKAQVANKLHYNKEIGVLYLVNYAKHQTNNKPSYMYNVKTQLEGLSFEAKDWLVKLGFMDDMMSSYGDASFSHPSAVITELFTLWQSLYKSKTGKDYPLTNERSDKKVINDTMNLVHSKDKLIEMMNIFFMTDRPTYTIIDFAVRCSLPMGKMLKMEKTEKVKTVFVKPTLEEVSKFREELGFGTDPQNFLDFYDSKGWKIGSHAMKDWKAAYRRSKDWRQGQASTSFKRTKPAV